MKYRYDWNTPAGLSAFRILYCILQMRRLEHIVSNCIRAGDKFSQTRIP